MPRIPERRWSRWASGWTGCCAGSSRCWPTATSRWSRTATYCACSPPGTCGSSRLPGDCSGWTPGRSACSVMSTASRSSCPGTCRLCLSRPVLSRPCLADGQDHVAGLLARIDVAVGLDHLGQRVALVDDGPVLPGLHEFLEEQHIPLGVPGRDREDHLLAPEPGPLGQEQVEQLVGGQVDAAGTERVPAAPERLLADRVEDDVVGLPVLREVFLSVVDDLLGAQVCDELQVLSAALRGDVGAEVPGELDRRGPDGSRGAVDEEGPPLPDLGRPQAHPGQDHPVP